MASIQQQGPVAGTGTAAGGGHGETSFPPFDMANFTPMLIWLAQSFGLLYLLMAKIALPRVESILH
ncbi:MAG: F0F1 ATP synthase subunit B', partial [Methylocella sp.]